MTQFECEFITKCLATLSHILADERELTEAINAFTQNDDKNPRYELRTKIPNALYWSHHELRQFSAAYSETIFRIISFYKQNSTISNEQINAAKILFEQLYIPGITKETQAGQRISSIIGRITAGFDFDQENEKLVNSNAVEKTNPHSFFFAASLLATASVAAAIYLSSSK